MPSRATQSARSRNRSSKVGIVGGAFFSLIFIGVGAASFYWLAIRPIWGIWQAREWIETPCTIISSELKEHHGDDSSTYSIDIVFQYTFNGKEYESKRYDFVSMSSNTFVKRKREIVRTHPPGRQTTCYVCPSRPSQAVIDRGWGPDMWWGLFPIPFLLIGLGIGLGMLRVFSRPNRRRRRGQDEFDQLDSYRDAIPEGEPDDDAASGVVPAGATGPVTLKSKSSPLGKFLGALAVTLFWNGIVSVFLWQVIIAFQRGKPEWGLTLFLTPFVLAGTGFTLFTVYSFLSIFNPRPILTVSSATVRLGMTIRVAWQFTGRSSSIRRLKVELQGKEVAEYTRGTSTCTDTERFATVPIIDTDDPFQMEQGELTVTVPSETMHSFQAGHNKIEWTLNLHGEIGLWPDVVAEFPIVVEPHDQQG